MGPRLSSGPMMVSASAGAARYGRVPRGARLPSPLPRSWVRRGPGATRLPRSFVGGVRVVRGPPFFGGGGGGGGVCCWGGGGGGGGGPGGGLFLGGGGGGRAPQ